MNATIVLGYAEGHVRADRSMPLGGNLLRRTAGPYIGSAEDAHEPESAGATDSTKTAAGESDRYENDIRGLSRSFGLYVGAVRAVGFDQRVRELIEGMSGLDEIMTPLLEARRALREQFEKLHRKLLSIVRDDEVCLSLLKTPKAKDILEFVRRSEF